MRLNNRIFIFLIFLVAFGGFDIRANATIKEKGAGAQAVVQGPKEITDEVTLNQGQKIVLPPFFQLQRKDSKVWIERIIVTLLMAQPKDCLKCDFNSPAFRKWLYDLLQSEKPETTIQSQAVAGLSRQIGITVDAAVQISRAVIIVR